MDIKTTHFTQAVINLNHLTHNMRLIQELVGKRRLLPAIKANAYGHGAEIICRHLISIGYTTLCVAHISEAVELIEKGLKANFIILSPTLPENSEYIVRYGFEPMVCALDQVKGLSEAARKTNKQAMLHVKIDTGMGRVGIHPDNMIDFLEKCAGYSNIKIKGIASHFAKADESDKSHAIEQIKIFRNIVEKAKQFKVSLFHFANSAAIFDLPESHFDAARPGISIYGLKPSLTMSNPRVNELRPVMTLKTRITFLKEVPSNTGLSYGHKYYTQRPSLIASIPVGYADGISRLLSDKLEVIICGKKCRQVGRICMDQCLVDVTELRGRVSLGDEVVIIGKQGNELITADDLAKTLGTINYEIVTQISSRVPRVRSELSELKEFQNKLLEVYKPNSISNSGNSD